ncbi:MAG TPA: hypothetical protein VJT69_03990 [Pyrinomonadaceae bacterium]|nr:hypothetical protein [Pyrinomonadaceae bacterium]
MASAILGSGKEKAADVLEAIDEIIDSKLRAHLLEWFYFTRATAAEQHLDGQTPARHVDACGSRDVFGPQITQINTSLICVICG